MASTNSPLRSKAVGLEKHKYKLYPLSTEAEPSFRVKEVPKLGGPFRANLSYFEHEKNRQRARLLKHCRAN